MVQPGAGDQQSLSGFLFDFSARVALYLGGTTLRQGELIELRGLESSICLENFKASTLFSLPKTPSSLFVVLSQHPSLSC